MCSVSSNGRSFRLQSLSYCNPFAYMTFHKPSAKSIKHFQVHYLPSDRQVHQLWLKRQENCQATLPLYMLLFFERKYRTPRCSPLRVFAKGRCVRHCCGCASIEGCSVVVLVEGFVLVASLPPIDGGADVCLCCSVPTNKSGKKYEMDQGFHTTCHGSEKQASTSTLTITGRNNQTGSNGEEDSKLWHRIQG